MSREEIYKLKRISEKLKEQLSKVKKAFDSAVEKVKYKKNNKGGVNEIDEKAKDKEIQLIQVQIKEAQKTIKTLKSQIEVNPSIDKYTYSIE